MNRVRQGSYQVIRVRYSFATSAIVELHQAFGKDDLTFEAAKESAVLENKRIKQSSWLTHREVFYYVRSVRSNQSFCVGHSVGDEKYPSWKPEVSMQKGFQVELFNT